MVDREGEKPPRAQEFKGLELRAVLDAVALQGDRSAGLRGLLEGKEKAFGLIDPNEGDPRGEALREAAGVGRVADLQPDHEDPAVKIAEKKSEKIRISD